MIKKIHQNMPPQIRKLYGFIIVLFQRMGRHIKPVILCSFKERQSGEELLFVHIGWDRKLLYYWLNRWSDDYKIKSQKKILTSRIPGYLNKNRSMLDLALVETDKKTENSKCPEGFLLPRWMEMELNIENSFKKSRVKNITRNIKKYSLQYEIRKGAREFDLFYYSMYLPFAAKRHGKSAETTDYKFFSNKYQNEDCELFFIVKENKSIAAAFVEGNNNDYRLSAFGILNADNNIFRMGVIGALYYFVMVHYYEKGAQSLKVGKSMPVVFDGVTEFKMQIGAAPYVLDLKEREKFWMFPIRTKKSVFNVLKLNPLYVLSNGQLQIALFVSDHDFNDKKTFLKFFKRLKAESIENTKIFFLERPHKVIQWLKEENIENIEYQSMKNITKI